MKKKKLFVYDKNFKAAAAVFGVSLIAAIVMFVLGKGNERDYADDTPVTETVTAETEAPVTEIFKEESVTLPFEQEPETERTKAYVITANTDDIRTDDYVPEETAPPADSYDDNNGGGGNGGNSGNSYSGTAAVAVTSRERTEFNGKSVYISMRNISQKPELPVGCEITALTILLNYWGFDAEKCDMARNYLPVSSGRYEYRDGKAYKDSFFDFFIGDPFSKGYGCFAHAIEKAAVKYLNNNGGGYTVYNISGCSPDKLYRYVEQDIPVIVWATDGMIEPEYYETWYDIDTGEQLDWYLNEHCAVLVGFDIDKGTVTLNDPMKGIIDYNINKFETRFAQMHSQAIVILPDSGYTQAETTQTEYRETEAYTESETETEPETEETVSEAETESETEETAEPETEEETDAETKTDEEEELFIDDDYGYDEFFEERPEIIEIDED